MEFLAVGEYLIVEKLSWLKTSIELPDSAKSDIGIVRGEILSLGNQQEFYKDSFKNLEVNDVILYDARVGLEIEKTGNFLIRFGNILAIENDDFVLEEMTKPKKKFKGKIEANDKKKKSELAAEAAFKKKPRKKKKSEKKRTISS